MSRMGILFLFESFLGNFCITNYLKVEVELLQRQSLQIRLIKFLTLWRLIINLDPLDVPIDRVLVRDSLGTVLSIALRIILCFLPFFLLLAEFEQPSTLEIEGHKGAGAVTKTMVTTCS